MARSSRQAADRVGLALLGSLMNSAEHSLRASSDRNATDCSLAIISTIVGASQEAYALSQNRPQPQDLPQQGIHSLTTHGSSASTAAPQTGAQPLAGSGPELLDMAMRSAAACAQQQGSMSSSKPKDLMPGNTEMHSSSYGLFSSYPRHQLEVCEGRLPSISLHLCESSHLLQQRVIFTMHSTSCLCERTLVSCSL